MKQLLLILLVFTKVCYSKSETIFSPFLMPVENPSSCHKYIANEEEYGLYDTENALLNERAIELFHELDRSEIAAIGRYTIRWGANRDLWKNHIRDDQKTFLKILCSALNKLPDYRGTVFSGGNIPRELLENLQEGSIYITKAFMSSSIDHQIAEGFAKNVKFIIQSKYGKDISKISLNSSEREILFSSGSEFHIHKIIKSRLNPTTVTIYMEEIKRVVAEVTANNNQQADELISDIYDSEVPYSSGEIKSKCLPLNQGARYICEKYVLSSWIYFILPSYTVLPAVLNKG